MEMNRLYCSRRRISAAVALALLMPAGAWAQQLPAGDAGSAGAPAQGMGALPAQAERGDAQTPAPEKANVQMLETITVTAMRRHEPSRDVPIQVNVLSADDLERAGAASLSDYVGNLPGVDFKTSNGPGLGTVSIRGITTGGDSVATVGMYIDDVAFGSNSSFASGSTSALDMSLLDLHHIEVLRGPQGTLYGAGAMGGLLKYVTNEPNTYEFSGNASLGVDSVSGGGIGHVVSGVVNLPLKEGVAALRVAAFQDHDAGYVDAVGPAAGRNVNGGKTSGGRVSLLVEPSSELKIRLSAVAQNLSRDGSGVVDYDIETGRPVEGDLLRQLNVREPYAINTRLASGDIEYDMGWARLNSITSYQQVDRSDRLDAAFYDGALTAAIGLPVTESKLDSWASVRKKTQEFRLTSAPGAFEWLAGVYYDDETADRPQVMSTILEADRSSLDVITVALPSRYKELAAYGDATMNFATNWSMTLGARVAKNKQSFSEVDNDVPGDGGRSSETFSTYLATLRYALSATSNVYLRAASGYRAGGPNPTALDEAGNPITDAPSSFKSDSLWSYELGYKGDLLDNRLSLELALYDVEWKDIQQPLAIGSGTIDVNAGKARVRGAELFTHYAMSEHWSLDAGMAYIDASLTEDAPALGAAGSRLPNSARFSGTFGAVGEFSLGGREAHLGANLRYVGERNSGFDTVGTSAPNFRMPSYVLTDLQGGVTLGPVDLGVYVRNVFDKRAIVAADSHLVAFGSPLHATLVQPRTVGVTLTTRF